MRHWLLRNILRVFYLLLFAIAELTAAWWIFRAQYQASQIGDSAVLTVEVAITLCLLGLLFWLVHRAGALARKVGTVRRGSPEEKQADRVLFHFALANKMLEFLCYLFWMPGITGYLMLKTPALYLHGALLVFIMAALYWLSNKLDHQMKVSGYA